jgi:hypothetical protein
MLKSKLSLRSQRFLLRIARQTSIDLRLLQGYLSGHVKARTRDDSARLWEALRTVGCSNVKVEL